ncbi:phage holin family protein [Streptomyces sp. NPDC001985]|uniref:phage holin family protein n=1 Tax=Streptomyces sp. NPDC001985 TaxID=3154406 RepID=UPI003321E240
MDRSPEPPPASGESVGELVNRASDQFSRLVRQELALARAEMREKGRRLGRGGGLYGGAGLVAVLALQALVATAVIALGLLWPLWLSALVITLVLFAIAGALAAAGRREVSRAAPPVPRRAAGNVKADITQIKESAHR